MNQLQSKLDTAIVLAKANLHAACLQQEQTVIEAMQALAGEADAERHYEKLTAALLKHTGPGALKQLRSHGSALKELQKLREAADKPDANLTYKFLAANEEADHPDTTERFPSEALLTGTTKALLAVLRQAGLTVNWQARDTGKFFTMLITV